MSKFMGLLIGIILVVAPILIVIYVPVFGSWGRAALDLIKGGILITIILIGLLFVLIGLSDMGNSRPRAPRARRKR